MRCGPGANETVPLHPVLFQHLCDGIFRHQAAVLDHYVYHCPFAVCVASASGRAMTWVPCSTHSQCSTCTSCCMLHSSTHVGVRARTTRGAWVGDGVSGDRLDQGAVSIPMPALSFPCAQVKRLQHHNTPVSDLSFDSAGEHVASCGQDNCVVVTSLYTDATTKHDYGQPIQVLHTAPAQYQACCGWKADTTHTLLIDRSHVLTSPRVPGMASHDTFQTLHPSHTACCMPHASSACARTVGQGSRQHIPAHLR